MGQKVGSYHPVGWRQRMKTLTLSTDLPQWVLELAEFALVILAWIVGREIYSSIVKQK